MQAGIYVYESVYTQVLERACIYMILSVFCAREAEPLLVCRSVCLCRTNGRCALVCISVCIRKSVCVYTCVHVFQEEEGVEGGTEAQSAEPATGWGAMRILN